MSFCYDFQDFAFVYKNDFHLRNNNDVKYFFFSLWVGLGYTINNYLKLQVCFVFFTN